MKKKVLFFIESLAGGGAEQVLVTLLRHFDYERYDVTLLTFVDCGVHLNDIDFSKVNYQTVNRSYTGMLGRLWGSLRYRMLYYCLPASAVASIIIPKGYDTYVAFVEGYTTKILSQFSTSNTTITKIAWTHIDLKSYPWTLERGIFKTLSEEINAYKSFDHVVCVSHSVEDVMREYYKLTNTTTIYNPIDVDFIKTRAQEQIEFTPSKGFNIVSVGRLVPQKGYDLLIPIVKRLIDEGLNITLYILGEGEQRKCLERQIEELRVQENIYLMGYCTNPYAIVSKMDVLVCSSRAEGYSLVIAEALSMGIPVISTNCSGPNELLCDNMYGLLCDNYEQLYLQIKNVVSNQSLKKELHEKAVKRGEELRVMNTIEQLTNIL